MEAALEVRETLIPSVLLEKIAVLERTVASQQEVSSNTIIICEIITILQ